MNACQTVTCLVKRGCTGASDVWNHCTAFRFDYKSVPEQIFYSSTAHCTTIITVMCSSREVLHCLQLDYAFNLQFVLNLYNFMSLQYDAFFESICQETSCLNHLLPDKRDPLVISKMCHPTWYPIPYNRTKRYQSFVNFALSHYQAQ